MEEAVPYKDRAILVIDLKSFYASVECVERGLDPMTTKLVVADPERGDRTICLAVSPAMKALGVKNRCRVFEIPKNIDYIKAPPRMQKYIDYTVAIIAIYLRYLSPDDIHVYSIDEAFLDVTDYLFLYKKTPKEMAVFLMDTIQEELGLRSTCGIGTNLYLAKIALDITAKHAPDFIGELTEQSYRETLWDHTPITDFWRVGPGTQRRLERLGITTMRGVTTCPEESLYKVFGIDAELLIDHAWGIEPVKISDIKKYKAKTHSYSSGQVLMRNYNHEEANLIVREMTDLLTLKLVSKDKLASVLSVSICYDMSYHLPPQSISRKIKPPTSSDRILMPMAAELYEKIADPNKPIRRVYIGFGNVIDEMEAIQLTVFQTPEELEQLEKDKRRMKAILAIKEKYGKNAVLRAMNMVDASTTRERNMQLGGHKSGIEE